MRPDFVESLDMDRVNAIASRELAEARRRLLDVIRRRGMAVDEIRPILELMRDVYAKVILAGKLSGMVSPWFPVVQEMPPGDAGHRHDPIEAAIDDWGNGSEPSIQAVIDPPSEPMDLALGDLIGWDFLGKAVEWLGQRISTMPEKLVGLVDQSQLKAAAFGQSVDNATMKRLNEALSESIFSGEGRDDWADRAKGIIETRAGFDETIQRTAHHQAYRNGQKQILEEPAIADLFPYRQYFTTIDGRERPTHRELDRKVYHKSSQLASTADERLTEWNCRCSEVPLTEEQALAIGVSSGGEPSLSSQARAFVGVPE